MYRLSILREAATGQWDQHAVRYVEVEVIGWLAEHATTRVGPREDQLQVPVEVLGAVTVERAIRSARPRVPELPEAFRLHDRRHHLASLLIASGSDVKVVHHRLRPASARTTSDTHGHMWPDSDESARAAVGAVLAARADSWGTGRLDLRRIAGQGAGSAQMS